VCSLSTKTSKRERARTAGRVAPLVLACAVEEVVAILGEVLYGLLACCRFMENDRSRGILTGGLEWSEGEDLGACCMLYVVLRAARRIFDFEWVVEIGGRWV
jgi:hypothetical protein